MRSARRPMSLLLVGLLCGATAVACEARQAAERPSPTTTIEGVPYIDTPRECDTERAVAAVCGRLHTIAGGVIRPVSGRQLSPGKISILPDGRVHYEEQLVDRDSFSIDRAIELYETDLVASGWHALPDNAPPHLRYELVDGDVTYVLTMDLRSEPGEKEGDVQLFVDAVVETKEPVRP